MCVEVPIMNDSPDEERTITDIVISPLYSNIQDKVKSLMMEVKELRNDAGEDDRESEQNVSRDDPLSVYDHNLLKTLTLINKLKYEEDQNQSIFGSTIIDETSRNSVTMETETSDTIDQNRSDQPQESKNIFQYRGFCALKEHLANLKTNHPVPRMEIRARTNENKDTIVTGISYFYDNNPVKGWKKELMLRMNGKTRGKLDIHYQSPDRSRKFRSRVDLISYFEKENIPMINLNKFSFHSVFCVCQTKEDSSHHYLECSYGKCGCNTWIHPECVGLGFRTEDELHHMDKVICPLCSVYLEGCGRKSQFENDYLMLKELTPGFRFETIILKNHVIEESTMPHRIWGLEGSTLSYKVPDNQMNYEIPDDLYNANFKVEEFATVDPNAAQFMDLLQPGHENNGKKGSDEEEVSIKIPQHSLFETAILGSTSINHALTAPPHSKQSTVSIEDKEEESIVVLNQNESLDRWRRKIIYSDGGITKTKMFGLWGNFTKVQQSPEVPFPDALSLANKYHYCHFSNANAEKKPSAAAVSTDTASANPPQPVNGVVVEEDPVLTAVDIATKVYAKLQARKGMDIKCDPTPSNLMKRKILDVLLSATKLTANQQVQRSKKTRGSNANMMAGQSNSVGANDFRVILGHVPMDDGSLKVVPVNQNVIPKTLHDLCTSTFCGFCFMDTSSSTELSSKGFNSLAESGSSSKKETENSLLNMEANMFGLTTIEAGSSSVCLHKHCKFMLDRCQFLPSSSTKQNTNPNNAANRHIIVHPNFHNYTEDDEEEESVLCSLCGKSGGLLFPFEISNLEGFEKTKITSLLTLTTDDEVDDDEENENKMKGIEEVEGQEKKRENSHVAHVPCLQYLQLSQSLNLPSFQHQQHELRKQQSIGKQSIQVNNNLSTDMDIKTEEKVIVIDGSSDDGENVLTETKSQTISTLDQKGVSSSGSTPSSSSSNIAKSLFEEVMHRHRCMLCGLKTGVVLRCLSIGCAVRAHPICVLFMKSWSMTKIQYTFPCKASSSSACNCPTLCRASEECERNHSISSLGFLCAVHKPKV